MVESCHRKAGNDEVTPAASNNHRCFGPVRLAISGEN